MKLAEAQQWAAVEDAVGVLEKAMALPPGKMDVAKLQHRGPPVYRAEKHLAEMRALVASGTRPIDLAPVLPK
ncbi:hypothetical protein DSI31_05595, partial [Mycobacterium tuberculosis]